ncbi:MAG: modification methylase SinI [Spirochaetae bacterium HGW-Spirochaetae-8]|nr:MAG: modification methylase SinI [Spirochaetae bacterium HGW-Spirochaetae-8]
MSTLIDVEQASRRLNLSEQQVRNLCRSGKINAVQLGTTWVLTEEAIDKYYENSSCGIIKDQAAQHNGIFTGFKTLSFFSGAMGLDTGLEKEGFDIILACEIDNACRKTIIKNKPNIGLIGNIDNYTPEQIIKMADLKSDEEIDLIVGGPPCQAFSTAGRRQGFNDHRGNVFLSFIDLITTLRPKIAVIENVRGLLSASIEQQIVINRGESSKNGIKVGSGSALMYIVHLLEKEGYAVSFNLYNSANYGTPQKRERLVIVCSRDGIKAPYIKPTHSETGMYGLPKWKTLKDAIGNIQDIEHHFLRFPEKRLQYYRMLTSGQNWRSLPIEIQKIAMGQSFYSGGGKTGFFRRLNWDQPSPTLVTNPTMPATDLAHPVENRPLSVEEYKRIQEFPDDWCIVGTLIEQYRQIGNAVPHSLGRGIGRLVKSLLLHEKVLEYPNFPYSRYKNTSDKELYI